MSQLAALAVARFAMLTFRQNPPPIKTQVSRLNSSKFSAGRMGVSRCLSTKLAVSWLGGIF